MTYGRADGTFAAPVLAIRDFGVNQGWQMERHPRQLADVNDDGAADGIGFDDGGAWISYGRTDGNFTPPGLEVRDVGTAQGWRVDQHPRAVADVTGDGRADFVGFGEAALKVPEFGYAQGWRSNLNPRALADRDGDGVQDIAGFGFEDLYRPHRVTTRDAARSVEP